MSFNSGDKIFVIIRDVDGKWHIEPQTVVEVLKLKSDDSDDIYYVSEEGKGMTVFGRQSFGSFTEAQDKIISFIQDDIMNLQMELDKWIEAKNG